MKQFRFTQLGKTTDGEERYLRFDMNAVADLELAMGDRSIAEIFARGTGFNFARHLIWAGLKWQDKKLTPRKVGQLIQKHVADKGRELNYVLDPAMDALMESGVLAKPERFKDEQPDEPADEEESAAEGPTGTAEEDVSSESGPTTPPSRPPASG